MSKIGKNMKWLIRYIHGNLNLPLTLIYNFLVVFKCWFDAAIKIIWILKYTQVAVWSRGKSLWNAHQKVNKSTLRVLCRLKW